MIVPQGWKFNIDKEISDDEYTVLNKFLEQYKDKDVIVADEHREDFDRVPFEESIVSFKTNKDFWKCMGFQRRIMCDGKPYIVRLGLWRTNPSKAEPKCLTIREFNILTPGKQHVLTLSTDDLFKARLFYNILETFDEKKIISPEAAYCERMYTNRTLQEFMKKHTWNRIAEGINQKPALANALFLIDEPNNSNDFFSANFATILYQLITYRKEHANELSSGNLLELDKLILKLSKTELLKVHLKDSTGVSKVYPTGSILLDWSYSSSQMRISEQYTVGNGELLEEKKSLNKVLRGLKKQK